MKRRKSKRKKRNKRHRLDRKWNNNINDLEEHVAAKQMNNSAMPEEYFAHEIAIMRFAYCGRLANAPDTTHTHRERENKSLVCALFATRPKRNNEISIRRWLRSHHFFLASTFCFFLLCFCSVCICAVCYQHCISQHPASQYISHCDPPDIMFDRPS